jgi:uncharacterized protein (TIGR02466 family)
MNISGIFPTPIGITELGRSFTDVELSFVSESLKNNKPNSGNLTSVDNYVLNKSEMKDLNSFCTDSLNNYLTEVNPPKEDGPSPYITQSWLNLTQNGGHHHVHSHNNSFISGVFYISADINADRIYFTNPITQHLTYPPKSWNMYNSGDWFFPVTTGILLLFPSTLLHRVDTKRTNGDRISLSFNTFLKGTLGSAEHSTELKL